MDCIISLHGKNLSIPILMKYTILCGDSATGKSTLSRLAHESGIHGVKSNIPGISQIYSPQELDALIALLYVSKPKRAIIILDENLCSVLTTDICRAIQQCDSFFILISRTPLPIPPTSDRCIFELDYFEGQWAARLMRLPINICCNPDYTRDALRHPSL